MPRAIDSTQRPLAALHDSIVALFGHAPLRSTSFDGDTREVRLSMLGGGPCCHPRPLVRIVETPRGATRELYLWWMDPKAEYPREMEAASLRQPPLRDSGCRTPVRGGGVAACRVPLDRRRWEALSAELHVAAVWSLADGGGAQEPRRSSTHAFILVVETLVGADYRVHQFDDAGAHADGLGARLQALERALIATLR